MDDRYSIPRRESESVEFKASMAELSTAVKAGAAMMNGAGGGAIYIGVRDDGKIVGIDSGDRSHDRLKREFDKITPPYWPMVETIELDTGRIVLRIAFPGNAGPYRYDDHAFIRIGASTHRMPEDQYQRLILGRYHTSDRWELKPALIQLKDLDHRRLVSTVETAISVGRLEDPGTRDPEILLQGLGLITDGAINNAAAVVFGTEDALLHTYPQCKVRLARFEGTTKNQFRDNRQYMGNLFELLRLAQTFVSEHNPIQSRIVADQIQRIDTPRYHPEVVREALVNALVHRDYAEPGGAVDVAIYDDRLVITSTGGLRFGMTVEDLLSIHQSRPWNQIVANVLQRQGSFESWGRGTLRMIDLSRTAGASDPVFVDDRHSFSVILYRNDVHMAPELNTDARILAALAEHGSLSISELERLLSWNGGRRQLHRVLENLRGEMKVELTGTRRWARWQLARGPMNERS